MTSCDPHRHVTPQILLDEIEAGGDSCRGPDRSIADIQRIGLDPDFRKCCRETIRDRPMRRDIPPVEEPGASEQEGTAADRSVASRSGRLAAQPSYKRWRRSNVGRVRAAGDDKRVNSIRSRIVNCPVWKEAYA
jgi:hypothetical protein